MIFFRLPNNGFLMFLKDLYITFFLNLSSLGPSVDKPSHSNNRSNSHGGGRGRGRGGGSRGGGDRAGQDRLDDDRVSSFDVFKGNCFDVFVISF
jgi:hypothetical protein